MLAYKAPVCQRTSEAPSSVDLPNALSALVTKPSLHVACACKQLWWRLGCGLFNLTVPRYRLNTFGRLRAFLSRRSYFVELFTGSSP